MMRLVANRMEAQDRAILGSAGQAGLGSRVLQVGDEGSDTA